MKMILANESRCFISINDFVNQFSDDMKSKFKKKYGMDIENWTYDECDQDVISDLLEDEPDKYIVMFVEDKHDGFFNIIKILEK